MLVRISLNCAGCGKRYKGNPGLKKFKCADCSNIFTFPEHQKIPGQGQILCSNCWMAIPATSDISHCPVCLQKIAPKFGGFAFSSAGSTSRLPIAALSTLDDDAVNAELAGLALTHEEMELIVAGMEEQAQAQYLETYQCAAQAGDAQQCQNLEGQLEEVRTQLAGAARANSLAQNERDALKQELDKVIADLECRLKHEREEKELLFGRLTSLVKAKHELETKLILPDGSAEQQLEKKDVSELEAHVAELSTRLASEREACEALKKRHDCLNITCHDLEARVADLATRLNTERLSKNAALERYLEAAEKCGQAETRTAQLEECRISDVEGKELAIKKQTELALAKHELEARVAEMERRHAGESARCDSAIRHRDQLLNMKADLETALAEAKQRLESEIETKEAVIKSRDKLVDLRRELEAETAKLQAQLAREREGREAASKERDELVAALHDQSAQLLEMEMQVIAMRKEKEEVLAGRQHIEARLQQANSIAIRESSRLSMLREGTLAALDTLESECGRVTSDLADKVAELLRLARQCRADFTTTQQQTERLEVMAASMRNQIENSSKEITARIHQFDVRKGKAESTTKASPEPAPVHPPVIEPVVAECVASAPVA